MSEKTMELIPLSAGTLEYLRVLRNMNRECFFDSHEITKQEQLEWYRAYLEDWWDVTYIITVDSEPVGVMAVYNINTKEKTAEVGRVMVDRSHRRLGYAGTALKLVMKYAMKELGMDTLCVYTKTNNDSAVALFESVGFEFKISLLAKAKGARYGEFS